MKKTAIILLIGLAFFACDDKPNTTNNDTPQPHESTITAFGKTIRVTGDATISTADFNTAKGKLESSVFDLDEKLLVQELRDKVIVMLNIPNFAMIIETGNASPDANANKSLTVGVNYLLSNDVTTIAGAIFAKINADAFADDPPQPIDKTYPITLKDGALVFTVAYKALPADEEPAYMAYIKERLEAMVASTTTSNINAVNILIGKGNHFTITIQYGEPSFTGMNWNTAEQSFEIHNDWIAAATDTDLTLSMMREAFNSVELETAEPVDKTYPITLKDGALVFTVAYKALPADEEPAYMAYLKTRLESMANAVDNPNADAVDWLLKQGDSFTITIKYGEPSFTGMNWNTAEQSFQIHNDWISVAEGNALSNLIMRQAFNAVGAE